MNVMPRMLWVVPICILLALPAQAGDLTGDQVIEKMDQAMTRAKDQEFMFEVSTQEPGKGERKMVYKANIKGPKWRRVEFLEPGDVKGMKFLSLSTTQMYVYLPAYKKIRRIASHVRNQGFMGTAFSYDEISIVTYGDVFTGQLTGETDKEWMVTATRRPGQEFSYAKLEMAINKEFHQPNSIKYYNDKGVLLKTETRTGYECAENICTPKTLHLVDHTRNGLSSKMVWTSWKRNTGIADAVFTQRELQR